MKRKWMERVIVAALIGVMAFSSVMVSAKTTQPSEQTVTTTASATQKAPKYVFLFIGDGMSYPQFQAASDYLGAISQRPGSDILTGGDALDFMEFPVAGSATTFDSTSFCPDSASTATSISMIVLNSPARLESASSSSFVNRPAKS